jgi:hypothetical protein
MVRASFLEDEMVQGGPTMATDLLARFFHELLQTSNAPLGAMLFNKPPKLI